MLFLFSFFEIELRFKEEENGLDSKNGATISVLKKKTEKAKWCPEEVN